MIDRLDVFPGWKTAITGIMAAIFNLVNLTLVSLGREPLDTAWEVNVTLLVVSLMFLYMKWRRVRSGGEA